MADIRLFTQQFNGTPAAKLSIVQPSGTTEYLPYGEDITVYIGSSDTVISVTTWELKSDTGAIFTEVFVALRSKHYPVISIDHAAKVFTFTGQDTKITDAGKPIGKYYFIAQTDGVTEYLEVSDTGCRFTDVSGIEVIEVDESAIEGGTSNLWAKVNPLNGQCTIAVKRISDQGKTIALEYFSLESYSNASLPPAYRFMSQNKWLTISATGDTLSQIATSQEIVYIEMFETDQTVVRQTAVAAILANKLPIFMWSARGIRTYGWLAGFTKTAAADGDVRINRFLNSELIIITLSPDGDSSDIIKLGGSSYTARSPLHISESGEIYMDPVGASPLSSVSTPPLDVLTSTAPAAVGGGHGNQWCSMDGHLFSVPNYFAPEMTDVFEYIVAQSQSASAVSTHYIAVYELDETNRQIYLCILSQNAAALDSNIGVVTVPIGYINPEHGTIKPGHLYYACHICDQAAVTVAGLTGNTFNLNPNSSSQPIGITKTNFCSTAPDGSIDAETIKTIQLSSFGMLAERHYVGFKHKV